MDKNIETQKNTQHFLKAEKAASARIVDLTFNERFVCVQLADSRIIDAPLGWFPWLAASDRSQRDVYTVIDEGRAVYWPDLDEHISIKDLLAGAEPCENCWYRITYFK